MMNLLEATESCLKKWITFSGRAPRSEYWFYLLFYATVMILFNLANRTLEPLVNQNEGNIAMLLLCLLASVIILVCTIWLFCAYISVLVRRLHDVGHTGWWFWIVLTLIGALFPLLVWKCTKGMPGDNRYGPDPLQTPSEPVLT